MNNPFANHVFMDSGAHGLYNEHLRRMGYRNGYKWYETDEFYEYMDDYALFMKAHPEIKNYVSVDVIFNAQMTWDSQKYLEKEHGLSPIPVIHYGTDRKWLIKYLDAGYTYIGLGGVGQEVPYQKYMSWATSMFDIICDTPDRIPCAKVHGFAMTSVDLMKAYPWYSVDSTSWLALAMYGQLIVPFRKNNEWDYMIPYNSLRVSVADSKTKKRPKPKELELLNLYLDEKGYAYGKSEIKEGELVIIERGVSNNIEDRSDLNAEYFVDFCDHLPTWPWPFRRRKTLFTPNTPMYKGMKL